MIAAGTFKNAIVFSNGCHSGYGVDSADDVPSLTLEPNWPEAFAQTQATLIAGTGYQYGDSDFIKYSESIYLISAGSFWRAAARYRLATR